MSYATIQANMRSALRQRLLTVVKATTGDVSDIGVEGRVITRATGSFLADGFSIGDEITLAGFATPAINTRAMIENLTATQITAKSAIGTEAAGATVSIRTLLPHRRAWEGYNFKPDNGWPFIADVLMPLEPVVRSIGSRKTTEHTFRWSVSLQMPNMGGTDAAERLAGAIMLLFKPGTSLVYGEDRGITTTAHSPMIVPAADFSNKPVIIGVRAHTID